MSSYLLGCDVLGAGPYVTVHVNDVPGLVRSQGGSAGALFQRFLPQTIEKRVYSDMQAEIAQGLKAKGIDAEVKTVTDAPSAKLGSDFGIGVLAGAGILGAGFLLVKSFFGRRR